MKDDQKILEWQATVARYRAENDDARKWLAENFKTKEGIAKVFEEVGDRIVRQELMPNMRDKMAISFLCQLFSDIALEHESVKQMWFDLCMMRKLCAEDRLNDGGSE